ncbi:hypothetical protein CcaverHIS002_0203840 [Cutaneotrichosporon cavernicola]|uniref:BZIP domain-containing protein n=1 Tax=Cutaneotrichosporon cavernicola TaxID=279322 RepID=A0AA48I0L3_9TREE|nr:uncharacterized protein CcaverHIS019_0203810 [Cutaneotrichosporon cavernicola]BEI81224.1 hypothetical protein CcaverHIS002_0203840 [Cutaneotrichosporon cavernicola]BEI89019.1 hypothetical protein CcaverHIS019_0203810 [Cutaneotrichosporon cavernicola]BEI96795.1 hypothetical protein CcaverHIS631_0203840 [Cutaneotrichosporon cavernicola]BEJ04567.1 hypothetical protein CcaverHIS641_0203840 [Cutaneotrichosporon cavernicola]
MPPLLGAADSFNSSSATIKADTSRDRRNPPSSNALRPQDSVGRELDALIGGRNGLLQSDNGVGDVDLLSRYLRGTHTLPGEISFSDPNTNTGVDPLSYVVDPSAPDVNFFADSEFETTNAFQFPQPGHEPASTISPSTFAGPSVPLERPSSSLSHRSHHSDYSYSTTEGSYVTTDDDGDDLMNQQPSAAASPSPLNELGQLNLGSSAAAWHVGPSNGVPQTISPAAQALGSSVRNVPPAPSSTASSSRRRSHAVSFPEEEDDKRQAHLEHRRSINRRSAQKHRLRRKEELENLSRQVAERDKRIHELERELAVAQGNLKTLMSLVQRGKKSE